MGHVAGSEVVVGGQAYSIDGDMWQKWDGVVGCGGMWQGVGKCGRGGGMLQGSGYVVGGQAIAWMGTCCGGGGMW